MSLINNKCIDISKKIDEIENAVYNELKQFGFRKHGRTLHRFVSDDISQVIHFQVGRNNLSGKMCVNIGIRIPECVERRLEDFEGKKYYQEYECNIRSRLGTIRNGKEIWYSLQKNPEIIIQKVVKEIVKEVLPVFDKLSTRQAILAFRRAHPRFDTTNRHLILIEEALIYAKLHDMQKAKDLFEEYYKLQLDEYNQACSKDEKHFLRKGERIVYGTQDITAKQSGFVSIYGASHAHIEYLDNLAVELGFRGEVNDE